jgi:hypothetical protein
MRQIVGRLVLTCVLAIAAASVVTGFALASAKDVGGDPQLADISKQVGDINKKLRDLESKGRVAKEGKLAAAAECGFGESSRVFLPWGDVAEYGLIPQGDLANTSGWSLKNVAVAGEHDPFTAGSRSLLFTKGDSTAVTPVMCVNLDHPTLRLFAADRGGNGKAHLEVSVLYEDLVGHVHELTLARLKVGEAWQPSVVIPIGVNILSVASVNGWTPVSFEFKVHGLQKGEAFSVDGVYVDPCSSR